MGPVQEFTETHRSPGGEAAADQIHNKGKDVMLFKNNSRGTAMVKKGIAFGEGAMKVYGIAKSVYAGFQVAAPYMQMAAAGMGL